MAAGRWKMETRTRSTAILEASFPVSPVWTQKLKWRPDAPRKSSREAFCFWSKEQERGLLWVRRVEEVNPLGFLAPNNTSVAMEAMTAAQAAPKALKTLFFDRKNLVPSRKRRIPISFILYTLAVWPKRLTQLWKMCWSIRKQKPWLSSQTTRKVVSLGTTTTKNVKSQKGGSSWKLKSCVWSLELTPELSTHEPDYKIDHSPRVWELNYDPSTGQDQD